MKDQKPIRFYTDNTLRMEVTGAGKVGIGTDQAQNLLHQHVTGNNNTYHQFTSGRTGQSAATSGFRIGLTDNGSAAEAELRQNENASLRLYTNATERMVIAGSGDAGIGVATPKNLLHQHITSNGNTYHQFTNSNTGSSNATDGLTIGLTYASGTSNAEFNLQETSGSMNFLTNNTQRMTIAAGGNIGIGVVSPAYRIDADNNSGSQLFTANIINSATYSNYQDKVGVLKASCSISRTNGTGGSNTALFLSTSGNYYYINCLIIITTFRQHNLLFWNCNML